MRSPRLERVSTATPQIVALGRMGRTAREAADTWTCREWAGRLAAQAGPRDYSGQLARLFGDIVDRWRYVAEPGEWIPGTARQLLGRVLGLEYHGLDPLRARLSDAPLDRTRRGWGDCDDVATLVAAGALALGMEPRFRVARGRDGAHVSVTVRTPDRQLVDLDPVGWPDHGPGWALEGPGIDVEWYPLTMEPGLSGPEVNMFDDDDDSHYAILAPQDPRGERVLSIPQWHAPAWARGLVVDNTPAVDQFGDVFRYSQGHDLWLPPGSFGRLPRSSRVARRRRVGRRIVDRFAPVVRTGRRIGAKILDLKMVQQAIASALAVTGTPVPVSLALLGTASAILKHGGLIGLLRMARKDPRAALHLLAQQAARVRGSDRMGLIHGDGGGGNLVLEQGRTILRAAPIRVMVGAPGVYPMGALEITGDPSPGQWYRVRGGDSLLAIAKDAYGAKHMKGAQWIARAAANAYTLRDPKNEFEDKYFPGGLPSLLPRYACDHHAIYGEPGDCLPLLWVPGGAGQEPPPLEPDPGPGPLPPEPLPAPPIPGPLPPLPPVDVDDDVDDDDDDDDDDYQTGGRPPDDFPGDDRPVPAPPTPEEPAGGGDKDPGSAIPLILGLVSLLSQLSK